MKKLILILGLFVFGINAFAQEDDNDGNDKIRDKMSEYIQKRLNLTKNEAEKFTPVFLRYFKEWRSTLREFRGKPPLDLQQKIVDLRLRYRNEFKDIVGEKRSNQVYEKQQEFIDGVRKVLQEERIENRANRRFRSVIQ